MAASFPPPASRGKRLAIWHDWEACPRSAGGCNPELAIGPDQQRQRLAASSGHSY